LLNTNIIIENRYL